MTITYRNETPIHRHEKKILLHLSVLFCFYDCTLTNEGLKTCS